VLKPLIKGGTTAFTVIITEIVMRHGGILIVVISATVTVFGGYHAHKLIKGKRGAVVIIRKMPVVKIHHF
jgi:hypothetical protein